MLKKFIFCGAVFLFLGANVNAASDNFGGERAATARSSFTSTDDGTVFLSSNGACIAYGILVTSVSANSWIALISTGVSGAVASSTRAVIPTTTLGYFPLGPNGIIIPGGLMYNKEGTATANILWDFVVNRTLAQ